MASGWGITGNKGRCHGFWVDFSDCMSRCREPKDCALLREDYLECLHHSKERMGRGLIWATAEDLARNRPKVISLYRQILRSLNSPKLPLTLAARLAKKAEVRTIFLIGSEERSIHNIADLIDTGEYALSLLKKGEIPKYSQ